MSIRKDLFALQYAVHKQNTKRKNQYSSFFKTSWITTAIASTIERVRYHKETGRQYRIVNPSEDTVNLFVLCGNKIY